jgi:hypothetical protein
VLCTLGYVRVRGGERVGGSGDYAEFDSPKPAVLAVDGVVLRFRRRVLGRLVRRPVQARRDHRRADW